MSLSKEQLARMIIDRMEQPSVTPAVLFATGQLIMENANGKEYVLDGWRYLVDASAAVHKLGRFFLPPDPNELVEGPHGIGPVPRAELKGELSGRAESVPIFRLLTPDGKSTFKRHCELKGIDPETLKEHAAETPNAAAEWTKILIDGWKQIWGDPSDLATQEKIAQTVAYLQLQRTGTDKTLANLSRSVDELIAVLKRKPDRGACNLFDAPKFGKERAVEAALKSPTSADAMQRASGEHTNLVSRVRNDFMEDQADLVRGNERAVLKEVWGVDPDKQAKPLDSIGEDFTRLQQKLLNEQEQIYAGYGNPTIVPAEPQQPFGEKSSPYTALVSITLLPNPPKHIAPGMAVELMTPGGFAVRPEVVIGSWKELVESFKAMLKSAIDGVQEAQRVVYGCPLNCVAGLKNQPSINQYKDNRPQL